MTVEEPIAVVGPLIALYVVRVAIHTRFVRVRKKGVTVGGQGSVILFGLCFLFAGGLLFLRAEELQLTVLSALGLCGIAFAFVIRAAALVRLGEHYSEAIVVHYSHDIVTDGVYRRLRHPLHISLCFELAGLGLVAGSPLAIPLVAALTTVVLHRNLHEELALLRLLGPTYARYLNGPAWDIIDCLPLWARTWLSR